MTKRERKKFLRDKFQKEGSRFRYKQQNTNLYVNNLDITIDDKRSKELFSPFGKITSAKVMVNQKTRISKGFGFVNFSSSEEATKAIAEMNDKMIGSKCLYVALSRSHEEKRPAVSHFRYSRNRIPNQVVVEINKMFQLQLVDQQMKQRLMKLKSDQLQNSRNIKHERKLNFPTKNNLAKLNPKQQKRTLGEFLFPLICRNVQPDLAGKVTGMFLEMENDDLLHYLENPSEHGRKAREAVDLLKKSQIQQPQQVQK